MYDVIAGKFVVPALTNPLLAFLSVAVPQSYQSPSVAGPRQKRHRNRLIRAGEEYLMCSR